MKYVLAAAVVAAFGFAAPAFAADGPQINWYGDLGYTDTDFGGGANLGSVTGRIGARSLHFGIEAEASGGVTSKDIGGASVKERDEYALDAVLFAPVANGDGDIFFRAGYGRVDIKATAGGGSASGGDNGWNAGVGGQWFPHAGPNGVRGDYTYTDLTNGGGHINSYGISYVRKF
jgi:outer membrane immunogenic protein